MSILVINGSPRPEGVTGKVAKHISENYPVKLFDLSQTPLPIFNGLNVTNSQPSVKSFLSDCQEASAFIILTPEYHSGISGALKNTLDFTSAKYFEEKPVLMVSVAGGGKGGINALNNLRTVMRGLYAEVSAKQMVIDGYAFEEPETLHQLQSLVQLFLTKNNNKWHNEEAMGL
ncbi:NADPH-dependent FMN reductase [Alteribacter populi]|uniref:NADPH-dependent FMN reductase n=1 Tax=Alteribacter populi TaxID=2011011 RepID=UPI001E51C3CD|nr:NAD(P)H-dependent oxidoreductase [Alteribacter populi]